MNNGILKQQRRNKIIFSYNTILHYNVHLTKLRLVI